MRATILAAFILATLCAALLLSKTPSNDRVWDREFVYTATATTTADGVVHLKNVRDFSYATGTTTAYAWIADVPIDPNTIVRAWFVLEPFAKVRAIGHTFVTFELSDGSAYSFSVEARREAGEGYSPWLGMIREYELAYTWGTERDFITRRVLYLGHPVRMYKLAIDQAQAERLFVKFVEKTNDLAVNPRFYNTLTANCTNLLAEAVNELRPDAIPYDLSWNMPGLSDQFLMKIGYITDAVSDLSTHRDEIMRIATSSYAEFGTKLRTLINL